MNIHLSKVLAELESREKLVSADDYRFRTFLACSLLKAARKDLEGPAVIEYIQPLPASSVLLKMA